MKWAFALSFQRKKKLSFFFQEVRDGGVSICESSSKENIWCIIRSLSEGFVKNTLNYFSFSLTMQILFVDQTFCFLGAFLMCEVMTNDRLDILYALCIHYIKSLNTVLIQH
jgi:hypothetical protein